MTRTITSKTNNNIISDLHLLQKAFDTLRSAQRVVAFTGAGISVESGIPPFRGPGGLWNRYDPNALELTHFLANPERGWKVVREIFYDHFGKSQPNPAHLALAQLEAAGKLAGIITQNIDNLHQEAGSKNVIEIHGNSKRLICLGCAAIQAFTPAILEHIPPICQRCGEILKPDFVFFGEAIPQEAYQKAEVETQLADVWLIIGTTGEVYPAAGLPILASRNGQTLIEVNIKASEFTSSVSHIFLQGKASEIIPALADSLLGAAGILP